MGACAAAAAPEAAACSDEGGPAVPIIDDLVTTPDGAVVIPLQVPLFGEPVNFDVELEYGEDVIGGTTRTIMLGERTGLLVFEPVEALVVDEEYGVNVTQGAGGEPLQTTVLVVDGSATGDLTISIDALALTRLDDGTGPQICCHSPDSCFGDPCIAVTEGETLSGSVDLSPGALGTWSEAVLSNAYAEVYYGTDGSADILQATFHGRFLGGVVPELHFTEQADDYCVRIDVVSVLDDSRYSTTTCTPHSGADLAATPVELDEFLAQCIDPPYWQATGEPFDEPAGDGTGGGSDGGGSDGDGAGTGGDPGAEGDGGSVGGDGDGCSCRAGNRSDGALAVLSLLGLIAFRRRR